jgi:hypothetical protein
MIILLDRFIRIYRASQVAGWNRQSYTTFTTSIECTIQPLGDEKTAMAGGSYGKMFVIYMEVDQNLVEGDQVRDYLGNIYEIVSGGLENRNDGFIADYMSVIVKKIN